MKGKETVDTLDRQLSYAGPCTKLLKCELLQ